MKRYYKGGVYSVYAEDIVDRLDVQFMHDDELKPWTVIGFGTKTENIISIKAKQPNGITKIFNFGRRVELDLPEAWAHQLNLDELIDLFDISIQNNAKLLFDYAIKKAGYIRPEGQKMSVMLLTIAQLSNSLEIIDKLRKVVASDLQIGDRVLLSALPKSEDFSDGAPEERGVIGHLNKLTATAIVKLDEEYAINEEDDRLRDVSFEQLTRI
ncbi:MAG: hypothetical protein JO370_09010 [Paucibacter sp.]|nr:hypothetical protein [Roseateles sp.]